MIVWYSDRLEGDIEEVESDEICEEEATSFALSLRLSCGSLGMVLILTPFS